MAVLATQQVSRTGTTITLSAASSGGDKLTPGDHVALRVKNAGGTACNVTIATPPTYEGQAVADVTVTVAATTGDVLIGPLPASLFRGSDGFASISYDQVTSVTVAAVSV